MGAPWLSLEFPAHNLDHIKRSPGYHLLLCLKETLAGSGLQASCSLSYHSHLIKLASPQQSAALLPTLPASLSLLIPTLPTPRPGVFHWDPPPPFFTANNGEMAGAT